MMIFFNAFLVGGIICAIGQLLMDLTPLTLAHVLSGYLWPASQWSGAGASAPITSFGHQPVQGALSEMATVGWCGVIGGF